VENGIAIKRRKRHNSPLNKHGKKVKAKRWSGLNREKKGEKNSRIIGRRWTGRRKEQSPSKTSKTRKCKDQRDARLGKNELMLTMRNTKIGGSQGALETDWVQSEEP